METFRLVTLNILGMSESIDRRIELIGEGLGALSLDAVALQEVCEQEGRIRNQAVVLGERLGFTQVWARAKANGEGLQEGLAILSRYPILDHRVWPLSSEEGGRIVQEVVLDSPAGPLGLFNTHLDYQPENMIREKQVLELTDIVRRQPRELPSLITGDFNATPEHDEIRFLRGRHTIAGRRAYFHDAYARVHPFDELSGETWAKRNPMTRRWRWLESDRRIDFIFVTAIESSGRGEVRSCRVVLDQPDDSGQFPSDHFGVLAEIQVKPSPVA
jgi:endonuclease/exonuclease/phosphatase family metal-dependent hydrolase